MAEKNKNVIRDYNTIRNILEKIYLYGYCSRDDFKDEFDISKSNYDKIMAIIKKIYREDVDIKSNEAKKKRYYFPRDYFKNAENSLINTYYLKSYTYNEFFLKLMALSLLSQKKCIRSDVLIDHCVLAIDDTKNKNSTMLRVIDDMITEGYINWIPEKDIKGRIDTLFEGEHDSSIINSRSENSIFHGGIFSYFIDNDIIDCLSDEEILDLYNYITLTSNSMYPRVGGMFLKKYLEDNIENIKKIDKASPFLIRHNNNRNVFDEEYVYKILECCEARNVIEIVEKKLGKMVIRPVKVRIDKKIGRWFVLGIKEEKAEGEIKEVATIVNISKIVSIKVLQRVNKNYNEDRKRVENTYDKSLMSFYICEGKSPYTIKAELKFGADKKGFENQFVREMLIGEIVEENNKKYYRAEINDPIELIPWLRSYSPYVKILKNDFDLDKKITNSLEEMLKKYEAI